MVACRPKKETSFEHVVVETLISATESWNGDSLKHPRGKVEMKLKKIITEQGFKTPLLYNHGLGLFMYKKELFIVKLGMDNH